VTEEPKTLKRFGTFGGVITPNVLTILGVIFFLRAGWAVGNTGLFGGLMLVVLANAISFATALSLSAIATNMNVKAGGAYYLISRSLGLEIGGSIGLPLYFSQALSVALYIMGFTEALNALLPWLPAKLISALVCAGLMFLAYKGADVAMKAQYFIMGILGLALLSFFTGATDAQPEIHAFGTYSEGHNFWTVFAIYFPAVTGIMAGLSMSGDLKEPRKNIPRGTLISVGVTFVIYLAQVYWFTRNASLADLRADTMIMQKIASLGFLIVIGVWAATLSSALGSLVAAPRTMQALAMDGVLPRFLGRGSGPANEPKIATLVTFCIAEASILLLDLDLLAPIITMFFLTTYGVTNLVAGMERVVGNPSYRPSFKVHWAISIVGALGCFWVMFLINAQATIVALVVVAVIYGVLKRRRISVTFGDLRSGIWFSALRFCLLKLKESSFHPRNWKPNVMVFLRGTGSHGHLLDFAGWLGHEKGIVTLMTLLPGDVHEKIKSGAASDAQKKLDVFLEGSKMTAFGKVVAVKDFYQGARVVAQAHGIAGLKANVAMFGWSDSDVKAAEFAALVRDFVYIDTSVLLLKYDEQRGFGRHQQIDVWWGGLENNGSLMILMAHLISQTDVWRSCTIRLLQVVNDESIIKKTERDLEEMLDEARISAEILVLPPLGKDDTIQETIRTQSAEADLLVLGLRSPEEGQEATFMTRMTSFMVDLPTTVLVKSINIEDIFS
jgi:amino acid transporter